MQKKAMTIENFNNEAHACAHACTHTKSLK